MRAVLIKDEKGPVENLYIGEVPKPTLGKGEVLVKESLIHWKVYDLEIEPSF
jgi:NADPH:quinone reductase-like Zn-dependent oxidoreductase